VLDFTPPAESTSWVEVKSYKEAERVFTDSDSFSNVYGPASTTGPSRTWRR
jgi:hypothetical protein